MARVIVAPAFARWLAESAREPAGDMRLDVAAAQLDQALEAVFEHYPALRHYLLDERGSVRHHVAVFVDGQSIRDKSRLTVPLGADSEVYLMQALSGG